MKSEEMSRFVVLGQRKFAHPIARKTHALSLSYFVCTTR